MTDRPKLYPGHQHQWTDADPELFTKGLVRCTVCGFEVPRNAAGLDTAQPDTDTPTYRVGAHEFTNPEYARMEEYAQGIGLGAYRPRSQPDFDPEQETPPDA